MLDYTIHSHGNTEILIMSLVLNSVFNVSKISSVFIFFFFLQGTRRMSEKSPWKWYYYLKKWTDKPSKNKRKLQRWSLHAAETLGILGIPYQRKVLLWNIREVHKTPYDVDYWEDMLVWHATEVHSYHGCKNVSPLQQIMGPRIKY